MKSIRLLGGALACALLAPASSAQAYALRFKGEGWVYGFGEKNIYFTAGDDRAWLELLARGQATLELGNHFVMETRLVGVGTLGADYYDYDAPEGFKSMRYQGRLDLFSVNLERLAGGRITLKLGRQEILLGEGFIVGDGVNDFGELGYWKNQVAETGADSGFGGAAQWMIPFKYWDGARLTVDLEPITLDFMAARLDPSNLPAPSIEFKPPFPGLVAAADIAWAGETANAGVTVLEKRVAIDDPDTGNVPSSLHTVAVRAGAAPGDWSLGTEVVGEVGESEGVRQRAVGARLNVKHTWSMNPYTPWVRVSGYFFSGDNAGTTDVYEGYDPLFYDWSDFGTWYLGNIGSGQWFLNSDEVVGELALGFMPTPTQNVKLLFYGTMSQTGVGICNDLLGLETCDASSVGAYKPLAAEANLIWDWCPAEVGKWKPDSAWYFGALVGAMKPLGPMVENGYDTTSFEGMLFMTVNL